MWRSSRCLLALLASSAAAAGSLDGLSVENPRAFGHFIGDTLVRRVSFYLPDGAELMPLQEEEKSRHANPWVELTDWNIGHPTHFAERRYDLTLRYQIVNSPRQPELLTIAGTNLRLRVNGEVRRERLPDWLLSVAPLTGDDIRQGVEAQRPSRLPRPVDIRRSAIVAVASGFASVLLILWSCVERWGFTLFAAPRGPFGRARMELRKIGREPSGGERGRRALKALHRAFDETAGRRVFTANLAAFMAEHGEFSDLEQAIFGFYAKSRDEFFGPGSDAQSSIADLVLLSDRLRRRERSGRVRRAAGV